LIYFIYLSPCLVPLWVCRRLGHKNAKWHSNKAGKNIAAHNFHALIRIFSPFFSRFGFSGFIADFVLYVSVLFLFLFGPGPRCFGIPGS